MALLQISDLGFTREEKWVLQHIHLEQNEGERVAIVGETGSGKTTLLKLVAGHLQPTRGTIAYRGNKLKGPEEKLMAGHPQIAYLSQHFELPNHYRVEEILNFENKRNEEGEKIFDVCGVRHLMQRKTQHLSGGERQRISLARLLAGKPQLLLLDEPFSNLDVSHTMLMKEIIDRVSNELGVSCILVSHDPMDALPWADKIVVLQEGLIMQAGKPGEVYRSPNSLYTAGLFGLFSVLPGEVLHRCDSRYAASANYLFRPDDFLLEKSETGLQGRVIQNNYFGWYTTLKVKLEDHYIEVISDGTQVEVGNEVNVLIKKDRGFRLPQQGIDDNADL